MRDRRRRTDLLLPRERQSTDDNNPFAPPPEGRPDQPWQPRRPDEDRGPDADGNGGGNSGSGDGGDSGSSGGGRSGWGSQWSSRQPGRSSGGGFGGRPGSNSPENGSQGSGPKWDPTDPAQRHARYAMIAGLWALFFTLFLDFPEIGLILGAPALYWAISALRTAPKPPDATAQAGGPSPQTVRRTQRTSAIAGLVMSVITLLVVGSMYTAQLVYRDFFVCERDALTKTAQSACNSKLPEPLRDVYGVKD
ncbi:hypothetical protein [Streptomyces qinzhouensis]|uniref:Integral membrane protein n=1 Tax=Streptomyces qinzhouensis TaxID=2599401 RepID=A0A5B8JB43_9ACTN|nr:hypothetical protein [Streptomyces qinzhouensis]QDY78617.1 hypothetical protein FQU76_21230 [Streptomyces qinzhouensis]